MTQVITTDLDYPIWICAPCGLQYGKNPNKSILATFHGGDSCGVCGAESSTTEPRDFGHLKDGWQNHKRAGQ
jgi:hypothetical protein